MASTYRGITIVNTISKIFSLCLRNRLNTWCEIEYKFTDVQSGFRDKRSTMEAIFILHTIIQKVLAAKCKLWCAFVDYERAFDTVNRHFMFLKLLHLGLSPKLLQIIKAMYNKVQSCVKLSKTMGMSEFFDVTLGLKLGEPFSPILFCFLSMMLLLVYI